MSVSTLLESGATVLADGIMRTHRNVAVLGNDIRHIHSCLSLRTMQLLESSVTVLADGIMRTHRSVTVLGNDIRHIHSCLSLRTTVA